MSTANYFTFIRIVMSPLFLLIYLEYEAFNIPPTTISYLLLFLFGISELTDACDGYFARKYNEVTDLGKILDPMADSIYRLSVFFTFTLPPIRLPMILIFLLFYRDAMISTLRTICALKGLALAARPSGKCKAVIQALAVFLMITLLILHSLNQLTEYHLHSISTGIATVACIYTLFSGVDYIYANRHYILQLLTIKTKTSR